MTWLNAINDQVAGIGATVVPGTMRDSLHILDTMLNHAGPKPEMVATDTASYSDIVFGLFRMLGYRFSPRITDLSDQRFTARLEPTFELTEDGVFIEAGCVRCLVLLSGFHPQLLENLATVASDVRAVEP